MENMKLPFPLCLDRALFNGNKPGERKGETKENNLTRLGVG